MNGRSLAQSRIDGASGDAVSSFKKRLSWASDSTRPVRVVCLTGMPGCGKEEALAVAQTLGFSVVRMGDVVREEALRRGLPITDATVGGMANAERQVHGMGIWAERTLPRITGERVLVASVLLASAGFSGGLWVMSLAKGAS